MAKRRNLSETVPFREREARRPLPARTGAALDDAATGMTHEQLVDALRAVAGLVDVGRDPPNFHFGSKPFLHFHTSDEGIYADVRFGSGDFEPVWVSTPREREMLLARVCDHIESHQHSRKSRRRVT